MEFGEKVRLLMKSRNMKQADLAKATGDHSTAVSNYLNGNRKPKVEFLWNLIRIFNDVDLNWLFRDDRDEKQIPLITGEPIASEDSISPLIEDNPEKLIEEIQQKLDDLKGSLTHK